MSCTVKSGSCLCFDGIPLRVMEELRVEYSHLKRVMGIVTCGGTVIYGGIFCFQHIKTNVYDL